MTAPGLTRLGYLQRRVMARLAAAPHGLTTADLDGLSRGYTRTSRATALSVALNGLRDRGLAATTGTLSARSRHGGGMPLSVWAATDEGRVLSARMAGAR